jgi:hypothetical protein
MAQLLAPRSARIGVPNVTGYKRIVRHKAACAEDIFLPAAVKRPLTRIVGCVADLFSFYAARSVSGFSCDANDYAVRGWLTRANRKL